MTLPIIAFLLIAIGAFFAFNGQTKKSFVRITTHALDKAVSEEIEERQLYFMARLAEYKGLGLNGERKVNRHGTNEVYVFKPSEDIEGGLPVVVLVTVYRDRIRYTDNGEINEGNRHWSFR